MKDKDKLTHYGAIKRKHLKKLANHFNSRDKNINGILEKRSKAVIEEHGGRIDHVL